VFTVSAVFTVAMVHSLANTVLLRIVCNSHMLAVFCILQFSADAVETPPTIELPLSDDTIDDPSVLSAALSTNLNDISSLLQTGLKDSRLRNNSLHCEMSGFRKLLISFRYLADTI